MKHQELLDLNEQLAYIDYVHGTEIVLFIATSVAELNEENLAHSAYRDELASRLSALDATSVVPDDTDAETVMSALLLLPTLISDALFEPAL
jgi:hypothetical protein